MSGPIHLKTYNNDWYHPGRSDFCRAAWMLIGLPLFRCSLLPSSRLRVALLRLFGARIGERVVIHSLVNVKYPWHLSVGNDCWIGESSWFDNLTTISLGDNVCVSQGAYLCTGNHDWSDPAFGLRVEPIQLYDGAWAGAMSRLLPGTVLSEGAVAGAGSVVSSIVPAFEIHSGNPAVLVRRRQIRTTTQDLKAIEVHAQ